MKRIKILLIVLVTSINVFAQENTIYNKRGHIIQKAFKDSEWEKIKSQYIPEIKKTDTIVFVDYTNEELAKLEIETYWSNLLALGYDSISIAESSFIKVCNNERFQQKVYGRYMESVKKEIISQYTGEVIVKKLSDVKPKDKIVVKIGFHNTSTYPDSPFFTLTRLYFFDNENNKKYPLLFRYPNKFWEKINK